MLPPSSSADALPLTPTESELHHQPSVSPAFPKTTSKKTNFENVEGGCRHEVTKAGVP